MLAPATQARNSPWEGFYAGVHAGISLGRTVGTAFVPFADGGDLMVLPAASPAADHVIDQSHRH